MFSLHERTKIRLCRAAFVLSCLLPTALVIVWAVSIRLPSYRRAHEQAIATCLGLQVRLGAVHLPHPGTLLYESLELTDPETGQVLAELPFVEIQTSGGTIDIQLPYPAVVNGRRTDLVWRLLQDHSRGNANWPELTFSAENVTLNLPDGAQTLTGVSGQLADSEADWRLTLEFRRALSGKSADEKSSFSLVRHRAGEQTTSTILLATGATPLPCSLAVPIWPQLQQLGKGSEFRGHIVATRAQGRWTSKLSGQLSAVDLDHLIARQFPHAMSGIAVAQFEELIIDDGRIQQARGRVRATKGSMSQGLVHAAATHLQLSAAPDALRSERALAYKQIDIVFALSLEGLLLQGEAAGVRGAILVDTAGRVVLGEPAMPSQPVVNLARVLVPQSESLVPAARELSALVGVLPIPPFAPREGQRQPAVQARILGPKIR